jgi:hypothetical protein
MQWWAGVGAMAVAAAAWLSQGAVGTLVVHTDNSAVQPVALSISGPVERHVPLEGAHQISVNDLPVGGYDVRPLFAGTVEGDPIPVQVERGSSVTITIPLSHLGGVRFIADSGMCEPGDEWEFLNGAASRAAEPLKQWPRPTATTCQREVGGLAPSPYIVQVNPPRDRLPPYGLMFQVKAGEWTTLQVVHPPVVVRGRVTAHGTPVPDIWADFRAAAGEPTIRWSASIQPSAFMVQPTDSQGRYAVALRQPGAYRQMVTDQGLALDALPGMAEEVTFGPGVNVHNIELGGSRLRVWFTTRGLPMRRDVPVTLTLQSPRNSFTRVVANPSEPFELSLFATGTYMVSASAQGQDADGTPVALASSRFHEVTVSPTLSPDVTIDLVPRDGHLDVVHQTGAPIEGAAVRPFARATGLTTDANGRVSLSTVPVGTRLSIVTRTWGVTCHTVTDEPVQRAVVAESSATTIVAFPHGEIGVRPPAESGASYRTMLNGATFLDVAGATCPVPFDALPVATGRVPGAVEFTIMLPPGLYTLMLRDGRVFSVSAPGRVEIR